MNPDVFLRDHWQKAPMFCRDAFATDLPLIEPDELAWLATQPDVESRLVFTEHDGEHVTYRLETGPFDDSALEHLPDRDWTLLVQDVEKHLPAFRRYLDEVGFIPDWRIDDLMISCAAPGGSVGPHVDHYDVFLYQASGRREWMIGKPGVSVPDSRTEGLSLVEPFPPDANHTAETGGVLYLPPGIPHWGIADDLCMTISIGCRTPTRRELQLGQERVLGVPVTGSRDDDDNVFYQDPDLDVEESGPGRIDRRTMVRLREQDLLAPQLSDIEIARVFGCVVTDPKAWLAPDAVDAGDLADRFQKNGSVEVHGMARVAWIDAPDLRLVFLNGVDREVDPEGLNIFRILCRDRRITADLHERMLAMADGANLVRWMADEGLFDAGHSIE